MKDKLKRDRWTDTYTNTDTVPYVIYVIYTCQGWTVMSSYSYTCSHLTTDLQLEASDFILNNMKPVSAT